MSVPALGQKVTLAATVTPIAWTTKATTGTKIFCDGAAPLGTVAVTAFFGRPRRGVDLGQQGGRERRHQEVGGDRVLPDDRSELAQLPNTCSEPGSLRSTAPRDLHPSEEAVAWSAHG